MQGSPRQRTLRSMERLLAAAAASARTADPPPRAGDPVKLSLEETD